MRIPAVSIACFATLLVLTGCTAGGETETRPSPVPTATELGQVHDINELVSAYESAGGVCDDWEQTDQVSSASASGNCSSSTVLMTFDSVADRDSTADAILSLPIEGETTTILVGENWIVNADDVHRISTSLGGDLLTSLGSAPSAEPSSEAFARQEFSGSGDMVQEVGEITELVVVTFSCDSCTRNTVVRSNGDESLLVNTIGAYSGSHAINLYDDSMTTRFEIEATGDWTLVLDDIESIPAYDAAAAGTGDTVFFMSSDFYAAEIKNDGDRNFTVHAYGTGDSPLIVNEIGAYSGVKAMTGPALIQVVSTGDWSITPQ